MNDNLRASACPLGLGEAFHDLAIARVLGPWRMPSGNQATVTYYPVGRDGAAHTHHEWEAPPTGADRRDLSVRMASVLTELHEGGVRMVHTDDEQSA
jgi:hypothetical protein